MYEYAWRACVGVLCVKEKCFSSDQRVIVIRVDHFGVDGGYSEKALLVGAFCVGVIVVWGMERERQES